MADQESLSTGMAVATGGGFAGAVGVVVAFIRERFKRHDDSSDRMVALLVEQMGKYSEDSKAVAVALERQSEVLERVVDKLETLEGAKA